MQDQHNILIADIGNSRTKFSYLGNHYSYANNYLEFDDMHEFIYKLRGKLKHFVYASVNKKAEEVLVDILEENDINHIKIDELIEKDNRIDFSQVTGMGTDRKLGLIGALNKCESSFITIDCGTAVTLNVVDKDMVCRGGAIFPDVELQLKVLNQLTDALPKVNIDEFKANIGSNTKDAIRFGVLGSVAGGIVYLLDEIIKQVFNGSVPYIFMTGGLAQKLSSLVINDYPEIKIDDYLVLRGIEELTKNYIKP
jgi:type III pantothenate kinase